MIVVVTGGRDYRDEVALFTELDHLWASCARGVVRLYHGGARGADALAHRWAMIREVESCEYPARWRTEGLAAGPKRNARMLTAALDDAHDTGDEVVVLAFPGGRGTADCVRQARNMGLDVREVA